MPFGATSGKSKLPGQESNLQPPIDSRPLAVRLPGNMEGFRYMAVPQAGFEPTILRLKAGCCTAELLRNKNRNPVCVLRDSNPHHHD